MHLYKSLCFFLFLLCSFCSGFAQNYHFDQYNIEKGLIESQVVKIYQDNTGYLWLGTFDGVSRFNGKDFISYTKADGLDGDFIFSICQDGGRVLIRTGGTISAIKDGVIKHICASDETYLQGDPSMAMLKGADGKVWFIDDKHLNRISDTTVQTFSITGDSSEVLQNIALDNEGNLVVSVRGKGIFRQVADKWVNILPFTDAYAKKYFTKILFDRFKPETIYLLTLHQLFVADHGNISPYKNALLDTLHEALLGISQDKQGVLWVGTWKGACYLKEGDPIHFTSANGFTNSPVYEVFEDNQDNIWLGTNGDGLYRFGGFDFMNIDKVDNTPLQIVMGIGGDERNLLWAATDGNGLLRYDGHTIQTTFIPSADPGTRRILTLGHKDGQPLLLGTAGGLWSLDHGTFRYRMPGFVHASIYDAANTVWAAANQGCYHIRADGITDTIPHIKDLILALAEVGRDSILLGTMHGLLLVRNGLLDTSFTCAPLASSTVACLIKSGGLVVGGLSSEGLFSLDLAKNTFRRYTTKDSLRSNSIYSLIADSDGAIWAGTGKGIGKFNIDPVSQAIHSVNDIAYNPVVEFNSGAMFEHDGKIWGGTTKGLYIYTIHPTSAAASQKPAVVIDSVNISGYGKKHVAITFSGIYYTDPENLQYQYYLKGFDKQFSPPSKLNQVQYTALPPGDYVFEVRAVTPSGIVSVVKDVPIKVTPAFYQTNLFFALVIIAFISLVLLIQWSLNKRKTNRRLVLEAIKQTEQARIRRQTSEDFHDDIGNNLTRIVVLADILDRKAAHQPDEVKSLINQIRDNARNLYSGAKDILWALDPQSDDLHEVILKIRNYAIDLFSSTDIELVFDHFDVYATKPLPLEFSRNISMIFKELLNNILKHADASQVTLNAWSTQNQATITLTDNGKGFDQAPSSQGRGLANIRIRAERINGTIQIDSCPGKGAKTKLTFNFG
jgi:signal transduction histidine kinase/ligand-binding sensor domain-containing protein